MRHVRMLSLNLRPGETLQIGDVTLVLLERSGRGSQYTGIGITAPDDMLIDHAKRAQAFTFPHQDRGAHHVHPAPHRY